MLQHLNQRSTRRLRAVAFALAVMSVIVPPVSAGPTSPALDAKAELPAKTATKDILVPTDPGSPRLAGKALLVAMRSVHVAAQRAKAVPVTIHLEPGIYDLGTASLQMTPGIRIEGSGIDETQVVGLGQRFGGPEFSFAKGVVIGADHSELADLTVRCENTSELDTCIVMANSSASPRLEGVRLMAVDPEGGGHWGLRNIESSPSLDFVEVLVANGGNNYGLVNVGAASRPDVRRSTIAATAGVSSNIGILNKLEGLPLRLTTVEIVATNGFRAIGVLTLPPGDFLTTRVKGAGDASLDTMKLVNVDVSALDADHTCGVSQGMYLLEIRNSRVIADDSAIDLAPLGDVDVSASELRASEFFVHSVNARIVGSTLLGGAEVLALSEDCSGITSETGTRDSCP